MKRTMMDGNQAAAEAMRFARIRVVSAYPITPQSSIAETLADFVADGSLQAKYLRIESEHSALSSVIGAQLTGVRAGTATASVGLALMHEVMGVASGLRLPIVMPVVNRSLVSPWNLWCDHQDAMAERDSGWTQLYAENCQEVLDLILIAYRWSEYPKVLLPCMMNLDGFFLSHLTEVVMLPDQKTVDAFLPPYVPHNLLLDPDNPMFINNLTGPSEFTEMRFQQSLAFGEALETLPQVLEEFQQVFGRQYSLLDAYRCDDAEAVVVTMGSMSGTARYAVDQLRSEGKKVGALKVVCFRPFPVALLRQLLGGIPHVGVIDRSAGLGAESGPLCGEVRAALELESPEVSGFIAGLGGRDVRLETFRKAFDFLLNSPSTSNTTWLDVEANAMSIREVGV
jgi:pyruvate ferredoxin oxidoreductase alpha subunit